MTAILADVKRELRLEREFRVSGHFDGADSVAAAAVAFAEAQDGWPRPPVCMFPIQCM